MQTNQPPVAAAMQPTIVELLNVLYEYGRKTVSEKTLR